MGTDIVVLKLFDTPTSTYRDPDSLRVGPDRHGGPAGRQRVIGDEKR